MSLRNFNKCKSCREWHWSNKPCDPAYQIYHEDYLGPESMTFHAESFEDAALKYAAYYNIQNEYDLMNDNIDVIVERSEVKKAFRVSAEPSIDYDSEEIELPVTQNQ